MTSCPIQLQAAATYNPRVPHEVFASLRRTSPIFWHEPDDGTPGFWVILKYKDIVEISTNATLYSSARGVFYNDIASGQGVPGALLTMDPPKHTFLRNQLSEWFAANAMGRLEPWLRKEAKAIMAYAASRGDCEFVYDMAAKLPLLTICEFMGVPEGDHAKILDYSDEVMKSTSDVDFAVAMQKIGGYGLELAASAEDGGNDLVAAKLRSLTHEGSVPEAEFANQFAQLIVAGNETTRTLLSNIMLELCARPELYRAMQAEPSIVPQAIEEFLRWTTPIYSFRRTATAETELGGHRIEAGQSVMMYYVSANRDEDIFKDPDTLDITRKPNRHLSFGVGRHSCLGAQVARLETRIFLEEFLTSFGPPELAGLPERFPSNSVNSWQKIPIRLTAI